MASLETLTWCTAFQGATHGSWVASNCGHTGVIPQGASSKVVSLTDLIAISSVCFLLERALPDTVGLSLDMMVCHERQCSSW